MNIFWKNSVTIYSRIPYVNGSLLGWEQQEFFCVLFLCTIFFMYYSGCKWWAHNHDYKPIFRSDSCLHIALNIHERTCILIKSCQNKGDSGVIISMLHGFYKPDLLSYPFFRVDWYCLFLYNKTHPVYDKHGPYSLISDIFWDFPLPLWYMQNKSTSWSVGFFCGGEY